MKRTPIRSRAIRSVGYSPRANTLQVEFITTLIYDYQQVPRAKFDALLKAPSKGRYFNANIRDRYPYVQRRRS